MRKQILLLVLGLMSSCTQPSVTVVATQSTAPIVKQSAVVPQVATSSNPQTQASAVVDSPKNIIEVQPDGTLISKGSGQAENIVLPAISSTPTAIPTVTVYTNSQSYVPVINPTPSVNVENPPIQNNIPATPCDGVDPNSDQCKNYLESIKPKKPPYSVNYPVSEDVKSGEVNILFKDEYKVRFSNDTNATGLKLVSQSEQNQLQEIEKILIDYGVVEMRSPFITEKNADDFEKYTEKECNCDSPNDLSRFFLHLKNKNIKEMIEKLRKFSIIREVNYVAPTTT